MRFEVAIPLHLWGECVLTIVHIINRLLSTVLGGKSHFEIIFKVAPSLDHLRVFCCLAYAVNVKKQDKFAARALPTIFMGSSTTKKG